MIDYQGSNSFRFSRTVTDFVAATYNNSLTVTGNFPGRYTIFAQNRNTAMYINSVAATSTLLVEGKCYRPSTNVIFVTIATTYHASVHALLMINYFTL